jgi:radical SAM protein with 4Fe4S-binding SPASM domain
MRLTRIKTLLTRMSHWESWRSALLRRRVGYIAPERPLRFPAQLQIEATSKCNLRCPSCSHAKEKGDGQHLTEEAFRKILNRLPWSPSRVVLCGIGEPLMNPQFFSLVDILAERGIKCQFYTNGTLLTARTQQAILSRRAIDTVSISCDGSQKETFESLRLGADFDKWKQSVQEFVLQAKKQRGRTLTVGLNVVVSKQNLHEVGGILRLARELGIGNVYFLEVIPVDTIAMDLRLSAAEISAVHEELVELAADLGLKVTCFFRRDKIPPETPPHCLQPWEYMFIRANGDVAPCAALFGSDKGVVVGNILEQDFETIWLGEPYRKHRRGSVSGTNELCRTCFFY